MNITNSVVRAICGLALIVPLSAQSGNQEFYRAYYLEQEERDLQAALDLYRQIADTGDSKSLRQRAKGRARSVAEELACTDFARLMPASAAFYVEVNSPGAQLRRLTEQLGLMRAARDGGIGLSPELIDGVLGMRGAAIAITEFDPRRGPTNGVLLFHPGDMKILRGVLETALPIGGREVDRIGGYPTYDIEGQALVTLTDRLAIASRDRGEIEAVVARLVGDGGPSLADAPGVERAMELRGDDLLFFCVNLEQMMPMIQNAIARETRRNRELQMALSFVDLESTKTIAGRIGVDDDGISLEVGIDLDEDHRNLAFNLLRLPGIDRDTLAMVPAGAAFFAASAITGSGSVPPTLKDARGEPIVTWMDFGREFYANIADVAFFTMPTVSRGPFGPMPDMALAMRVNDVERSRSLWQFVFQTAQAATNKGTEGEGRNLGEGVERYEIAGVPVFLATHDDQLLITPSAAAIEATVAARKGNKSILDDDVFARALANMSDGGTVAAAVNMGRCAEIATHFMNDRERREMMPIAQIVEDTSIAVTLQQTSHRAGINAQLSGIG